MRGRGRGLLLTAGLLALVTAGCADGSAGDSSDDAATAPADPGDDAAIHDEGDEATDADVDDADDAHDARAPSLSVVATLAPVADLVRMVGGDRVAVTSLVPAGADSHTYEPRPQDVALVADADAYLGVGLDLNAGAVRLAEENVGDGVPVVLLGELALTQDDLVFDHSHDDDGGHSHDDDGGHSHDDDGDELGPNPHVWTSLRNAAALIEAIADVLSDLDPDGEDHYREQAADAQEQIADLDRRVGDATATIPAANRTLVTYHDAWTYFARDYRLEFVTAVQPADYSEPSAAEVRAVIDLIREREVPAVFGSEVFPTPVLEAIAEETGAAYVGDLADDVLPGDAGDPEHTYLELMRRNALAIVTALGGDASQLGG